MLNTPHEPHPGTCKTRRFSYRATAVGLVVLLSIVRANVRCCWWVLTSPHFYFRVFANAGPFRTAVVGRPPARPENKPPTGRHHSSKVTPLLLLIHLPSSWAYSSLASEYPSQPMGRSTIKLSACYPLTLADKRLREDGWCDDLVDIKNKSAADGSMLAKCARSP
jgi:hypothetical protein